jgi:hypothetical protein
MKKIERGLNGGGMRIGIVQSRFNADICDGLLTACLAELHRLGVRDAGIMLATVPGALETPLVLSKMASSSRFDGLIALGARPTISRSFRTNRRVVFCRCSWKPAFPLLRNPDNEKR